MRGPTSKGKREETEKGGDGDWKGKRMGGKGKWKQEKKGEGKGGEGRKSEGVNFGSEGSKITHVQK